MASPSGGPINHRRFPPRSLPQKPLERSSSSYGYVRAILGLIAALSIIIPMRASATDSSGVVLIQMDEDDAHIHVDGQLIGSSPIRSGIKLSKGRHRIDVRKEGFMAWTYQVDVKPQQSKILSVVLIPTDDFVQAYKRRTGRIRTAAWITGAAGLLLAGTSAVLKLNSDGQFDDLLSRDWLTRDLSRCEQLGLSPRNKEFCPTTLGIRNNVLDDVDAIETMDTIALTTLIVGVGSALTSAVLFIAGDDPHRYDLLGLTVAPGPLGQARFQIHF